MAKQKYSFVLDTMRKPSFRELEVVNGDTGLQFEITLKQDGVLLHTALTAALTVIACFRRADGRIYLQDANSGVSVSNSVVTIDLYATSFTAGTNECELQVYTGTDDADLVTSARFLFVARGEINNSDSLLSWDQYPMLVLLESRLDTAAKSIEDMTVEASGLAAGSVPTVVITDTEGHKNIAFGIPQGLKGNTGAKGAQGEPGDTGPTGAGVQSGGSQGQVLVKASSADYDTTWQTPVQSTVDAELSATSENPVQNKAVKAALDNKAASLHTHTKTDITNFPETMPPSAHSHAAEDVTGIATLDANGKVTPAQASARSVDVSASKTLALTDAGTRQRVVATSAITITVPPDSTVAWSDDTEIEILQIGAGLATIAPGTGVTLSSEGPATTSRTMSAQYTGAALVRTGSNAWVLIGALA